MLKRIFFLLAIIFFLSGFSIVDAQENLPRLLFFYSPSCHACQRVKEDIMPEIEKEFAGKINIEYLDVADMHNYQLMLSLKEKYNCPEDGVPTIFVEGVILVGYDSIKNGLRYVIEEAIAAKNKAPLSNIPLIDLAQHFLSFRALAIISAGLVDGINPCAFTVIVFFISFLAFQGYRRRELIMVGSAFIFAIFLTYVFIGLGIFRFLYALRGFHFLTKIIYYAIAIFCFALAAFALYDLWLFKKTGLTEGMTLQLPQVIKHRIHSVIGAHYRKTTRTGEEKKSNLAYLVISAFFVGFLISLLEAVCTGQLYLPTITFVLKEPALRLRALGYLLLYNLMFIIPLVLVLLFALLGATSEQFASFIKKHMAAVKIVMAIIFILFGVIILLGA